MRQLCGLCWAGTSLCVQTLGPIGKAPRRKAWSVWLFTWGTNVMSTRWAGMHVLMERCCKYDIKQEPHRIHKRKTAALRPSHIFNDVHFSLSRTKIFIRHPRTLFATEDAFQVCKHKLGEVLFGCHSNASSSSCDWVWMFRCCSNKDPGQVQRLQNEGRLPKTEGGWWVGETRRRFKMVASNAPRLK